MSKPKTVTLIIFESAYGKERAWNALRMAQGLVAKGIGVNIFLIEDGVNGAKKGQKPPEGYYNLEKMLEGLIKGGVKVRACITCLKARGLAQEDLVAGVEIGKTLELGDWIMESHAVISF